jgi:hypothetical protein
LTPWRGWWVEALLTAGLLLWTVARAQDLPDPTLDLPVHPSAYAPVASTTLTAPDRFRRPDGVVPLPPVEDDPRDEPPPVFFGEEIESENGTLVYVLDVSGSMRSRRLPRAKVEAERSIRGLPPSIRFNAVSYSCTVTRLWPTLRPASDGAKVEAIRWVRLLQAGGGTGTGPACALALSDRQVEALALLTDGAPGCGEIDAEAVHRRMISSANAQHATINVFGIEASGQWREFCQDVAADSGGNYTDVP